MGVGSMSVHDLELADGSAARGGRQGGAAPTAPPPPPPPPPTAAAGAFSPAQQEPPAGGAQRSAAAVVAAAAAASPKLVFYLNGQPLPAGTTVFQAIQQMALANSRDSFEEVRPPPPSLKP